MKDISGGVGLIVEVTTDNKNRSASEIRSFFEGWRQSCRSRSTGL